MSVEEGILADIHQTGTGACVGYGAVGPQGDALASGTHIRRHQNVVQVLVGQAHHTGIQHLADDTAGIVAQSSHPALVVAVVHLSGDLLVPQAHLADDAAGIGKGGDVGAHGAVRDGHVVAAADNAAGSLIVGDDGHVLCHIDVLIDAELGVGERTRVAAHIVPALNEAVTHHGTEEARLVRIGIQAINAAGTHRAGITVDILILPAVDLVEDLAAEDLRVIVGAVIRVACTVAYQTAHGGGTLDGAVAHHGVVAVALTGGAQRTACGARLGSNLHRVYQPVLMILSRGGHIVGAVKAAHRVVTLDRAVDRPVSGGYVAGGIARQTAHNAVSGDAEVLDGIAPRKAAIKLRLAADTACIAGSGRIDHHIRGFHLLHRGAGKGDEAAEVVAAPRLFPLNVLHVDVIHGHVFRLARGHGNEGEIVVGILVARQVYRLQRKVSRRADTEDRAGHGPQHIG